MTTKQKNQWICFKTNFREEFLASNALRSEGFNVLMPYYFKTVRHSRKEYQVKTPMFPFYGFMEYDDQISSLNKLKYTRGINYYLQHSDGLPKVLPWKIINEIQSLKQIDGSYKFNPDRFNIGDEVKIIEGVFVGLKAIFNQKVDNLRSRLLIDLVGRINKIDIQS